MTVPLTVPTVCWRRCVGFGGNRTHVRGRLSGSPSRRGADVHLAPVAPSSPESLPRVCVRLAAPNSAAIAPGGMSGRGTEAPLSKRGSGLPTASACGVTAHVPVQSRSGRETASPILIPNLATIPNHLRARCPQRAVSLVGCRWAHSPNAVPGMVPCGGLGGGARSSTRRAS